MLRLTSVSSLATACGSLLGQNWDMDVFTSVDMVFHLFASWDV